MSIIYMIYGYVDIFVTEPFTIVTTYTLSTQPMEEAG